MKKSVFKRIPVVLFVCFLITGFVFESPAFAAYSRSKAITYAHKWALSRNSSFKDFGKVDCTNFVSQCLNAGDKPMDNTWKHTTTLGIHTCTSAWSNSASSYAYWTSGGRGIDRVSYKGNTSVAYPSWVNPGDIFYYDWYGYGIGHAAFYSAQGKDVNCGYTGALIDQHSTDRREAIWSLSPYNADRLTTWIYCIQLMNN